MKASVCPVCGAPLEPGTPQCPFWGQYFEWPASASEERSAPSGRPTGTNLFQRQTEPHEGALSLSVPRGWSLEGGIFRADLMHQTIDAQSVQAKLDSSVKRDASGSVMIRWGPETKNCDLWMTPAGMMGLFLPGSNYQGMVVYPVMSAHEFLVQVTFPWAHPVASQVQIVDQQNQPELAAGYQRRMAALIGSNQWQHRWVTEGGEEYYTDDEYDNPNVPGVLNRSDWKRTPIRPRFPQ